MNKKNILKWLKYFMIITSILFLVGIIAGSTYIYLNLNAYKAAGIKGILTIFSAKNIDESISAELGVEVVYKLCAAVYYSILHVLAYSALASAVISTVICAIKKKKA